MSTTEGETTQEVQQQVQQPQQTVNLDNLSVVQSLNVLWSMLNQASSKGAFTIDESYVLKVIFQKLTANLAPDTPIEETQEQNESSDQQNVDV
jgi:hypothetical protein